MEKVEVKTTETRRRWFSPALAWNRRAMLALDEWLLRHLPPKVLAWGGLIIAVAMLAFTWLDGPEMLRPIFGGTAAFLWVFMWLTVPTVPVGGRLFTTWAGAAARKADPREIITLQRRGAIIIATCVVFATIWAIYTKDFYTKAYVNFVALGIGTNIAMAQQKLKTEPPRQQASPLSTIICLSMVPVALFGLMVDVYMSIEGAGYESGVLGWLFHLMPELTVRTVVPPCYDFLSLCLVGYVLAGRTNVQGWERVRVAAKITISGVGFLIGFILLGGYVGGWLADIYRTGHGALPDQLRQLLAITVVTRAPSYLIGGFGAAVISGLGAKASTWVRAQVKRLPRPGQSRIVALEQQNTRIAALEQQNAALRAVVLDIGGDLTRLQEALGLPAVEDEIERIFQRFQMESEEIWSTTPGTSSTLETLDAIEEMLASPDLHPDLLLSMGRTLQLQKQWLKEFRRSSRDTLTELHGQSYTSLVKLCWSHRHFEPWITRRISDLKDAVIGTKRDMDAAITRIERRRNRAQETWTSQMQALSARLREQAERDTQMADKIDQALGHN